MLSPLNADEPIFDVAQLAHVELLTPDFEGPTVAGVRFGR